MKKTISLLQEFSVPLIAGVIVAMIWANVSPDSYDSIVHAPVHQIELSSSHGHDSHSGWNHYLTLHFLVNDIFMVFFFGIAAKEITEACLPNGALNPVSKAINPLFGTIGGVLGPIGVFFGLNALFGQPEWRNGWGIPTATDIALAWLVMRCLFGKGHPAVSFLLLLAVADDAIGLGIIAIGYPDPAHPTEWMNLLWLIPGLATAFCFRRFRVQSWMPYIFIGGTFSWYGLYSAHLHPALALVFIVPFLPGPATDQGLYVETEADHASCRHSPLENFENDLKGFVDFGLFAFAFANAGVGFAEMNGLTWLILASLVIGKTLGIAMFSGVAVKLGFPLPAGMTFRHLIVTGVVAGLGLTVALFVCGQAFTTPALQGASKMGAVFSVGAAFLAAMLHGVLNSAGEPEKQRPELAVAGG